MAQLERNQRDTEVCTLEVNEFLVCPLYYMHPNVKYSLSLSLLKIK